MIHIDANELRKGIELVFQNARELLFEAELLFDNERYARSYTLSQFCIEELGKSRLLFECLIFIGDNEMQLSEKEFRKKFLSHQFKTFKSTMTDLEIEARIRRNKGAKEKATEEMVTEIFKSPYYDQLKNNSLYTSYENQTFFKPSNVISKEFASERMETARLRYVFTVKELKKWLEL